MTRSQRYGDAEPTHLVCPDYVTSDFEDCRDFAEVGGFGFLEWQEKPCEMLLGRRPNGRWAASIYSLVMPRQNGKTLGVVEPRINYGMGILGERWVYTSHLQKTSTETFEDIASFWDSCAALRKQVKAIKTALGREEITLRNGARIKFLARTSNGGRGQHGDGLVFDEALQLSASEQASFKPVISASPNPQTIYMTTPPDEKSDSAVIDRIRKRALAGASRRAAWVEWGLDEFPDGATEDELVELAYRTNPSMGWLINEDTVRDELEDLTAEGFARERLGWWSVVEKGPEAIFTRDEWDACATETAPTGDVCYGVKIAPDGSEAALCACWRGEVPHFELVDYRDSRKGLAWLSDWLDARASKCALLAVDGRNSDALTSRLENYSGNMLHVMRTGDAIAASALLVEGIRSGTVSHYGQSELDGQAYDAVRRSIGRDAWCIGGERSTAIEAAACALWAATNAKRNPGKKMRLI